MIPFRAALRVCWATVLILLSTTTIAYAGDSDGVVGIILAPFLPIFGVRWLVNRSKSADAYRIWYGTNRNPTDRSKPYSDWYGSEVDEVVHYGSCVVSVPKSHKFGSIGSSAFQRWLMRLFTGIDDILELHDVDRMASAEEFTQSVRTRLSRLSQRTILVFIHGYNVSFHDAAIRAAQIGFDLKVPGITALFSWPSKARVGAYIPDCDNIDLSEGHISDFLVTICNAYPGAIVDVIAHSMGNRGFLRALSRAQTQAALKGVKFGQIFLAAPDIDARLFRQLASVYPEVSLRTTLYVSAVDKALLASRIVHENQRTGYTPPVMIVDGIDTVEVTNIDLELLGHGYYAEAAGVLYDMASLIRLNESPDLRPALVRIQTDEGKPYWSIRAQN